MTFNTKQVNRKIFTIAAPIAVQGVVSATLTMVDNIMVGMLGETELAAVGVGGQMFFVHFLILFSLAAFVPSFMLVKVFDKYIPAEAAEEAPIEGEPDDSGEIAGNLTENTGEDFSEET